MTFVLWPPYALDIWCSVCMSIFSNKTKKYILRIPYGPFGLRGNEGE